MPTYEALSYSWADELGDSTRCSPVYVGAYWDVIHVTNNCANALRTIRHQEVERTLWADALCIDHEDLEEKAHKVRFMH